MQSFELDTLRIWGTENTQSLRFQKRYLMVVFDLAVSEPLHVISELKPARKTQYGAYE